MKKVLVLLLSVIASTTMAQVKEHNTNPNGLEFKLDTKVITENNAILFRYRENRVEINHPAALGNTYDIDFENADYVIKNGTFYVTPRLEAELINGRFIESGKDIVVLTIKGKNTGQVVLRQEFKVLNYLFPKLMVNGAAKLFLVDKDYVLTLQDVMTNQVYPVKGYSIRIPDQELKGQGNKLSDEAVKAIHALKEHTIIEVTVSYTTLEDGQLVDKSAGGQLTVEK